MTSTRVHSVPPGASFVDALAHGLLARFPDPLSLSQAWVLLPNRRSGRDLAQAFLRASEGKPLLLPRFLALGEMDADELNLRGGEAVPPALSARRRQMLLSHLIRKHRADVPLAEAMDLAKALGRLMDDAAEEGVDLSRLDELAPEDLAAQWQITLGFLKPVMAGWPGVLAAEGAVDPGMRRNLLLRAQAAAWREAPVSHPVIIAGSTSMLPAIVDLKAAVLGLPQGEVILPGLPPFSECTDYWDKIDVTHPLAEVKELLEKLEVDPAQVKPWVKGTSSSLWQTALLPAEATSQWLDKEVSADTGLSLALAASAEEEATAIALRLRHVLEEPTRTGMLVTPDRNLARRVAEMLKRWDIAIDDSAGTPLSRTPPAVFLRLVAEASRSPVQMLTLLKHPLAAGGLAPGMCRSFARAYELMAVRSERDEWNAHPAREWIKGVESKLDVFTKLLKKPRAEFTELLRAHLEAAEAVAASDTDSGAARLWRDEAGEALAAFSAEMLTAAEGLQPLAPHEYADALAELMDDVMVRPLYGEHPRLALLGPLEAELRAADVVVLGGLNEGTWPALPAADPWLSRPMRKELGLQAPERRIGREAHDFLQLASHAEVMLTRSARVEGAPTVPSRWLQRLETVADDKSIAQRGQRYIQWARQLDKAAAWKRISPPAPRPPVSARPRELGVTRIEVWRRDPYALYAEKILKLRKLDPLEAQADVADKGTFLHKVLERFLTEKPQGSAADLMKIAEDVFAQHGWSAAEHRLWWPRLAMMAEWFVETMAAREAKPKLLESSGETALKVAGFEFTLTAKADRIDVLPDGRLVIVDYKSGVLPQKHERERGFSPQLPLTAFIAEEGGFDFGKVPVAGMEFWKLADKGGGSIDPFLKEGQDKAVKDAAEWLLRWIAVFANPEQPYEARPWPRYALRHNDYAHLARLKEWSAFGEEGE